MMLVFFFLLNMVLITRAPWVFDDEEVRLSTLTIGCAVQLSSLLFLQFGVAILSLAVGIIFVNLLTWLLERRTGDQAARLGGRLIGLVCWFVILGFLCSDLLEVSFGSWTIKLAHTTRALSRAFILVEEVHLLTISAVSAGVIIAVIEAHTAVRFLFQILNVKPMKTEVVGSETTRTVDQVEYNRGRVIGALERLMTFFFVMNGAYGALGFLIAAKGMTRFKQLDDREFAEYFLIGTFLSIILAGSVALLTQCTIVTWS